MPVMEAPTHENVKTTSADRYGCRNRPPMKQGYWAPNGTLYPGGSTNVVLTAAFIPHRMSTDCKHSTSLLDWRCEGCKHRGTGDRAYAEYVKKLGENQ